MYYLIKINGIYDILCALSILHYVDIPYLNTIHLNMIENNENNLIFKRYFAYWILTYGCMRLTKDKKMIKISYFIEAICLSNELYFTNDIHMYKALFVIIVSFFTGIII